MKLPAAFKGVDKRGKVGYDLVSVPSIQQCDRGIKPGADVKLRDCLLIFVVAMAMFVIGLPQEFLTLDVRFAVFAQEMLRNGPTFFPTTYGEPYPDYPATSTLLIYLASLPTGEVTPFTATLPTAVASALVLVVIYLTGALHSRRWGAMAVVMAMFTKTFFSLSRCISLDQYVSLVTVLSFYIVYTADLLGKRKRLWWVPVLLIAGFACRGPMGTVVPAGVVCGYYAVSRDWKRMFLMGVSAAVMLAVCLGMLLAAAAWQGGSAFVEEVIRMQVTGRLADPRNHDYYYYLTTGPAKYALALPLALAVAAICARPIWREGRREYVLMRLLVVWLLVVLVGFSVVTEKKIRYILPAVPPMALLAGWLFAEPVQQIILMRVRQTVAFCCKLLPLVAALYGVAGLVLGWSSSESANYAAVATFGGMMTAGVLLHSRTKDESARETVSVAAGALTMALLVVCVTERVAYLDERSRPFVERVESFEKAGPESVVFYAMDSDKEALRLLVNYERPIRPDFVKAAEGIEAVQGPAYIIARESDMEKVPLVAKAGLAVLYRGRFDAEDCVVLLKQ
jgi:4-amino-4-deoxy-L-arabinose transferase-like glycosyltransferase